MLRPAGAGRDPSKAGIRVRALILAAGFAERLRPLTKSCAKPLLPVGGRPVIDWIVDGIERAGDVDQVTVITNALYAESFRQWAGSRRRIEVTIVDDGVVRSSDRLGAVGDLGLVIASLELDEDLLVVAGDNLCDIDFRSFIEFARSKKDVSCIAVRRLGEREDPSLFGVVALDADKRVVHFVEKPLQSESRVIATAVYVLAARHLGTVRRYLAEGHDPDLIGSFVGWLSRREAVYAFEYDGEWYDIGDLACLLQADNAMRERRGLHPRDVYSLER